MEDVHPQRFGAPPEPLDALVRSDHRWHLVRGEILDVAPAGAAAPSLPFGLADGAARPPVLARVDLEELAPWTRPRLETVERARDFFIADARGRALVRLADDGGRLHPDVELHLGTPFSEHPLRDAPTTLTAYVRAVAAGEAVYVLGRARLEPHPPGDWMAPGLRDTPLCPTFDGDFGPLHVFDVPAFERLAAWYALPWYRKLSLLVRNR